LTLRDIDAGDWSSRERNPVALAMARVLKPGVTLYVDIRQEEFFLAWDTHREWLLLPDEVRPYACRVDLEGAREELTMTLALPSWALVTERSLRKAGHHAPPA
jgi:hypothetical protein